MDEELAVIQTASLAPSLQNWTSEDFESSERPYKMLYEYYQAVSPFLYEMELAKMDRAAKTVGFKRFKTQLKAYFKSEQNANLVAADSGELTKFDNQPLELISGDWDCTDFGIYRNNFGRECACAHAIMPIKRMVNIDTNEVKIQLAYKRSGKRYQWQSIVVDKATLATSRNIVALAKHGISVTSTTASVLVDFLNDIENLNYDIIQEAKSIGRLGYISGEGFSPYVDGLVFDGDAAYKQLYNSVTEHGDVTAWFKTALECRKMSVAARIVLASAFASVLVEPLGCLPFFVHLWGVDSGTGKTVALMLAASVWGNPSVGNYVKTFDATQVGTEKTAAFLNHLPLCLDELQLTKDAHGRSAFDVYKLAQGVGRTRGNVNGGIDQTPTWRNCILTTGESPIVGQSAGAGAVNRVIEVECTADSVVIADGMRISAELKQNYGFAGRWFVDQIYGEGSERILGQLRELYRAEFEDFSRCDTTEKQAMAAAAISVADFYISQFYFKDDLPLLGDELKRFLATKDSVSVGMRAYHFFCDWVSQMTNHFRADCLGDVYGEIDGNVVYIIRSVFNQVATENGFDPKSVLSYLRNKKMILIPSKGFTKMRRISGIPTHCVGLIMESDPLDYDQPPF